MVTTPRSGPASLMLVALFTSACSGDGGGGGGGTILVTEPPPFIPEFQSVAAGDRHTCGLDRDGVAWCWGFSLDGQLGPIDPTLSTRLPRRLAGPGSYATLVSGRFHTCGLTQAGEVDCWGTGPWGPFSRPTRIVAPPMASIATGRDHTCGIDRGGVVVCWGLGTVGQLGDGRYGGSHLAREAASLVPTLGSALRVAAGREFACAVTDQGARAYCWGTHDVGQLGLGGAVAPGPCEEDDVPFPCVPRPMELDGLAGERGLAAGWYHACALSTDGDAACWGDHGRSQLGVEAVTETCLFMNGSETPCSREPVRVSGLPVTLSSLYAGGYHTCGLTPERTAYCWGDNTAGQLGDGGNVSSPVPRAVAGGLRFVSLSTGGEHTCAVTGDGTAYCWGDNRFGQLGIQARSANTPTRVGG